MGSRSFKLICQLETGIGDYTAPEIEIKISGKTVIQSVPNFSGAPKVCKLHPGKAVCAQGIVIPVMVINSVEMYS